MEKLKTIQHLYWRAGFGIKYRNALNLTSTPFPEIVDQLFTKNSDLKNLPETKPNLSGKRFKDLSSKERKTFNDKNKKDLIQLNKTWFDQLGKHQYFFREKMTLFWANHFACREKIPFYAAKLNNTFRQNALGNFKTMLSEVSKSPAMIRFLNNQQNKKGHPNENFAREVMELFTLGIGNYSEEDIKEAARAFTGWGIDRDGEYVFRQQIHDIGKKTILRQSGNFDGDEVLNILLNQKATARHISAKIYFWFVNETPNEANIDLLANYFYEQDYDIEKLMRFLFTRDWFIEPENIGVRIKSPIELLVGLKQTFDVKFNNAKKLVYLQRLTNQVLFMPPNVAGWPGGQNWIDSSTLPLRLDLPLVLIDMKDLDRQSESVDPKNPLNDIGKVDFARELELEVDFDTFEKEMVDLEKMKMINFLILPEILEPSLKKLMGIDDFRLFTLSMFTLPEYQLC